MWAVVAGGGTGGHLYPGLAVARALVARGHDPSAIHFVGARRGLEARTRALEGFSSTFLPGRGLTRKLSLRSAVANVGALAGALGAMTMAVRLFAGWRPAVVVSLGGYASMPCVVAAALWRVPVVVVNVDAVPGTVNRLAARLAVACAVGTPDVRMPRAVFTGVPVRAAMAGIDRSAGARRQARERLGLPAEARVVAVSGGSLGSLRINQAASELVQLWSQRPGIAVRHVVGRRDWDQFRRAGGGQGAGPTSLASGTSTGEASPSAGASATSALSSALFYQQVEYEEDMAGLYSAADVAVQRAGANTVAELALAGVPAVLVPLPGAPGDHQGANARAMAKVGGAVVVPDGELDGKRLAAELDALLADPATLASSQYLA